MAEYKLHPIIRTFAEQMQKELVDNADKGNFFEWTNEEQILSELEYHKAKLIVSLRKNPELVKEYLADCANFLMALGNTRGLYDLKPLNP